MGNDYINKYAKPFAAKNNFESQIIKNVLSKSEVEEMEKVIDSAKSYNGDDEFYQKIVLNNLGRMHVELIYPEHIKKKFEDLASSICGEEVVMTHNSYLEYSGSDFGDNNTSELPFHYDSDNYYSKITFDYQLDKTIDWPIFVESEKFVLEYMDLLIFWGAGRLHWREKQKFDINDNVKMLTCHFSNLKDYNELNLKARNEEERKERIKHLVEMKTKYFKENKLDNKFVR